MKNVKKALLACAIMSSSSVFAAPITYTFEGIGSGSLGTNSFTDQNISFSFFGDTDDITENRDLYKVITSDSIIDISGFGENSFTTAVTVFMNQDINALGFQNADCRGGADCLDIKDDALAGYDLSTSIGPIFENDPYAISQFDNVSTLLGSLTLTDVEWVNFTAVTDNASVSEPGSLALLGLGLLGLGYTRRKAENKA